MANSCKLSEEMVVQILSRLPPKSLLRFRSVRKLWLTIINNPSFVVKHLSNSLHNKFASSTRILFKHTILKDNSINEEEIFHVLGDNDNDKKQVLLSLLNLYNYNDDDGHYLHSVVEDLNVPLPMGLPYILRIVGQCDGIICLNTFFDDVVLCNPAIKEFEFLPKSCLVPPQDEDGFVTVSYTGNLGFGYDSNAKDYKVVRIAQSGNYKYPTRVEMYTLGTHSWREIKNDIKIRVFTFGSSPLYLKGIHFWMAFTPENDREVILSFDMRNELFNQIYTPDDIYIGYGCNRSLSVWKESIALWSSEVGIGIPKSFQIWIMDEFGDFEGLWTKHITIEPLEGIEASLMIFWKSDELLMVADDGRVVSYNLSTQKHNYLPIHGAEGANYIQAIVYVDSIVSIKERNACEHG